MRTHVTVSIWVLGVSSIIAVLLGIATIATAYTYTHGLVDRTTAVMSESIKEMEQVVGVLHAHEPELQKFGGIPSRIEATMRDLPRLTEASSEVLAATTDTLDKTASLIEAMDGRGDLMLSGSPLKESAAALRQNTHKLRALHEKMAEAQPTLELTVSESTVALQAARSIGKDLRGPAPSLDELGNRLRVMHGLSDDGTLAAGVAGLQALVGGLYLLIGLLLGGLASVGTQWERRRSAM